MSCIVHYSRARLLGADAESAWRETESFLRAKYADKSELAKRVGVAAFFHRDPGAFINLPAGD